MSAPHARTAPLPGQPAMIPLHAQLADYADSARRDAEFKKARQANRRLDLSAWIEAQAKRNSDTQPQPASATIEQAQKRKADEEAAIVARLQKAGLAIRSHQMIGRALADGDKTTGALCQKLGCKRPSLLFLLGKLLNARFVSVSGYSGRERIWHWKG